MEQLLLLGLGLGEVATATWLLSGLEPDDDGEPEPPSSFDPVFGAGLVTSNRRTGGLVTTNQRSAGGSGDD